MENQKEIEGIPPLWLFISTIIVGVLLIVTLYVKLK